MSLLPSARPADNYSALGGIFLSLGSNLGDREVHLRQAIALLGAHPRVRVLKISGLYETAPRDLADQRDFLNCAIEIASDLSPRDVLRLCAGIEDQLGRKRGERFGPRPIDLDILLYREEIVSDDDLALPHPRLTERRFVLEPLGEIAPDRLVPGTGATVRDLLARLFDGQRVEKLKAAGWIKQKSNGVVE
jgi:2-amino-4-hydroxy-6-hydroxymethyldihydropteridine diphosphokinase